MDARNENSLNETEDTQHGRFLTFVLGEEEYGIEIKFVTEIVGMQTISSLPEVPDYVRGIINLRGKIIPVIDMRLKLKKEPEDYSERTCIVVIDTGSAIAGIIVDQVSEVISISDEDIAPPPESSTGVKTSYIQGIGKTGDKVKLLLDCEKIFTHDELKGSAKLTGGNNK